MQMTSQHGHKSPNTTSVAQLLNEGRRALAVGHYSHAERVFRRAVQIDPLVAEAWRGLAETQYGSRRGICLRWADYVETRRPLTSLAPKPQPVPYNRPSRLALGGAAAALLLVIGSDIAYRDRMLPGVNVGGVDIGNMKRESAEKLLVQHQAVISNKPIQLRTDHREWKVAASALLAPTTALVDETAFAYGHDSSFARRTLTRLRAFAGYDYRIDTTQANRNNVHNLVGTIAAEITREQRDAQLLNTADGWKVLPEQVGTKINQEQVRETIATLIDTAEQQTTLSVDIPLIRTEPQITGAELEPARKELETLAQRQLLLQINDRQWMLDRSMLMQIDNNAGVAKVTASRHLIEQQIDRIASEVVIAPQPSQLVRDGNRVRSITPSQPGRELDRAAAYQAVADALTSGVESISLPMRELPAAPGEAEQLGLVAELGRGVSQFKTYSSPERDANVQAGGNEVDGVLIAPGEVFSFTGTIRDITWEEGYRWGEMIEAGVVVPSLGGGICQVSTTVFRAAFWSGLEIVERHNHTWRLAWYEVDAPPGMDATIALGGPDLKFRNNTGHHLLLKVETDLERKQQTVIIYGTPDGRRVAMDAVAGGNIGVRRSVIKPDGAVANETYLSYYTQ